MTYDGFGRKVSMSDPDMGNWTYAYNAAGSLTEQRDANLARLCFEYDTLNRLTTKRHDHDGNGCATTTTQLAQYLYFTTGTGKVGKPSEIRWGASDTQNRETFDYDSLGRLITHNRWVDSHNYQMSYSGFDALHRPGTRVLTWPNSNTHTTTLSYDHEGENTLVGGGTTLVTAVGYNDMGQLKRLALNNGLTTWYGYLGYSASGNNDAYDATWGQFGKLTVALAGRQRMGAAVNWRREGMWGYGRQPVWAWRGGECGGTAVGSDGRAFLWRGYGRQPVSAGSGLA